MTNIRSTSTTILTACATEAQFSVPLHVPEDVALVVSGGDLEGERGVVTLQHGRVVVQNGQFTSCVTQEGVCPPGMIDIMHGRRDQSRHLVDGVQTLLRKRHTESEAAIAALAPSRLPLAYADHHIYC